MGFTSDDLLGMLKDIEALIREKTNPDGSCNFESFQVMVSLELIKKMILKEANSEETV